MRFAEVDDVVYGRTREGTWAALKIRPGRPIENFVYPVMGEEEFCEGEKTSFLALTETGELRMVCGKLIQECGLWYDLEGFGYPNIPEAKEIVSKLRKAGRLFAAAPVALEMGTLDERENIPQDAYQIDADCDIVWESDNRQRRVNIWCKVSERVIVPIRNKGRDDSGERMTLRLPDDAALAVRQWAKARGKTPQEIVEGIIRTSMRAADAKIAVSPDLKRKGDGAKLRS